jgi:hypothetical protein
LACFIDQPARQAQFDPERVHGDKVYADMGSPSMNKNWRKWWDNSDTLAAKIPVIRANVKALVDAGVAVAIGTEMGIPAMIFGSSVGYEMELHVEAGLTTAPGLCLSARHWWINHYSSATVLQCPLRSSFKTSKFYPLLTGQLTIRSLCLPLGWLLHCCFARSFIDFES